MAIDYGTFTKGVVREDRLVKVRSNNFNETIEFDLDAENPPQRGTWWVYLEGMARVIDLGDTLTEYIVSRSGPEADYLALRADVTAIGQDMRTVLASELEGSLAATAEPEAVAALSNGQEE